MKLAPFGTIWLVLLILLVPEYSAAQNPYYDHGSYPAPGTVGSSAGMRAELDLIEAGFAKLPTLSGNADKFVVINGSATAMTATDAPILSGVTFPSSPGSGRLFIITDDSVSGACDSAAGTAVTLCRWDGSAWVGLGGGVSGWPSYSAIKEITWANSLSNALLISGGGVRKWALYDDATDGLQFRCVVNGVVDACNIIRLLGAGFRFEYKNSSGTPIFTLTESTGAMTNVTLDAGATGNTITSRFYWDLDLCGVSPADGTTTGHIWNRDPLSTAPTLTADVDTNVGRCYATFLDTDTTYGVQITRHLPDGFVVGTLGADIWWNTTGTGNARFQIQTKCYADDEADDAAFNTATITTAAAGTSGRPNKQNVATIDTTGCVGGELIRIRFFRVRTEASDTLNAALNVEKVFFKGWDAQ